MRERWRKIDIFITVTERLDLHKCNNMDNMDVFCLFVEKLLCNLTFLVSGSCHVFYFSVEEFVHFRRYICNKLIEIFEKTMQIK